MGKLGKLSVLFAALQVDDRRSAKGRRLDSESATRAGAYFASWRVELVSVAEIQTRMTGNEGERTEAESESVNNVSE